MREQPEAVLKRLEQAVLCCHLSHHLLQNALRRHRPEGLAATDIKVALLLAGTPIGPYDTAIAGHAIAAVLVTNNVQEFERVSVLVLEDWVR